MLSCVHTSHPNYDCIRMHDGEDNSTPLLLVTLHKHIANTDTRTMKKKQVQGTYLYVLSQKIHGISHLF
jgi:hypothetical protein